VVYFSTELEHWEIQDQIVEARAGGTAIFPNGREPKQHERERLSEAGDWMQYQLKEWKFTCLHNRKLSVQKIAEYTLGVARKFEKQVVIVDQASRIARDDASGRRSYTVATEDMLNDFEAMTADLGLPVVLLTQANRAAEGQRPTMANFKHSGAFEEYAHCAILLHRDGGSDELVVPKNRHGRTGYLRAVFHGESHTWDVR